MEASIKIDLHQGTIEASGSIDFVEKVYQDFKQKISENKQVKENPKSIKKQENPSKSMKKTSTRTTRKTKKTNPQIVKDLDLSGKNTGKSLDKFYSEYELNTNWERNIGFVYYINNELKIEPISIDHIFTCYRSISGLKIPGNLEQSIRDTKIKKGWLDYEDMNTISLTVHGINQIEHNLHNKE